MKRSVKQVIKVVTLSGVLGALGGLLSPPRLKGSKGVSHLPDPSIEKPEVPVAEEVTEAPAPKVTPKKRPPASSKSKTAAASKPKSSSTARIPKTPKTPKTPRPPLNQPKDQSGGSEK